jgi:hypothetical protein
MGAPRVYTDEERAANVKLASQKARDKRKKAVTEKQAAMSRLVCDLTAANAELVTVKAELATSNQLVAERDATIVAARNAKNTMDNEHDEILQEVMRQNGVNIQQLQREIELLRDGARQASVAERLKLHDGREKLKKDQADVKAAMATARALISSAEKKEGREIKRLSAANLELERTKETLALSNNGLAEKVQEGVERAARLHEEQQSLQKERAQTNQGMLNVLADEKSKITEANRTLGDAMEKSRGDMLREKQSYEDLRKAEVGKSEEYIGELAARIEELAAPLDIRCGRGMQYDIEYELFCQESMMYASSPQQMTKIVQATLDFLERIGRIEQGKKMKLMGVRQLQRVRCDAAVTQAIMVGIEVALADEILCVTMDETGVDNRSLESTMLTLRTADQRLLQYAADGVDILTDQCSATTMESTLALEKRLRQYSFDCRSIYDKALEQEHFPGMDPGDFDEEYHDVDNTESKVDQFGETKNIEFGRTRVSTADHAPGATCANELLYGTPEKPANLKSVETMERMFGKEGWAEKTPSEKRREQIVHQSGCHHHLWCIGTARGQKACQEIKAPLIKDGLEAAKAKGIYISAGGEANATIRSMLKGFGSTTEQDHHSIGPEYKAHTAAKDPNSNTPFLSYGRIGKSKRQDAAEELSFLNELKRESMLDFCGEFNWAGAEDINYLPATSLALGCEENEVESVLYGLVFAQIRDVHRTIVASGGKSRDANKPWIAVEKELQAEVGAETLPSCGPLECYEILHGQIIPFMRRVIADPKLLMQEDAQMQCFTTETTRRYVRYTHAKHNARNALNAAGKPTTVSYWKACREVLMSHAATVADVPLFHQYAKAYFTAFIEGVEANDLGWFKRIEDKDPQIEMFREWSKFIAPYSRCESFFGQYKEKYRQNQQVREDGVGARAAAQQNQTYAAHGRLAGMTKLAKLVVRAVAKGARAEVTKEMRGTKRKATAIKVQKREDRKVSALEGVRAEYSRAMIEYGTELPTRVEYVQFLGEVTVKKRRAEKTRGAYNKIVEGWGMKQFFTNFDSSDPNKRCTQGCTHTVSDGDVHMEEHVTGMLTQVDDGTVVDPGRPPRPTMLDRSWGNDLQLGRKASDYHVITEQRRVLHDKFMNDAERNPEEHSPVVPLPNVEDMGQGLVGRKIEVRLMVPGADGVPYLHCFEGTIKAFAAASAKRAAKWGCGKHCAVAHVEWDEELKEAARNLKYAGAGGAGRYPIPLDNDFYSKENKHLGWNLLSESFVRYQLGVERQEGGRGGE